MRNKFQSNDSDIFSIKRKIRKLLGYIYSNLRGCGLLVKIKHYLKRHKHSFLIHTFN